MKKILFICILSGILPLSGWAQDSLKTGTAVQVQEQIAQAINNKHLAIEVDKAMPMRGGFHLLSPSYTLKISGDSVITYLPYFGVSQQSMYGESEGGIRIENKVKKYKVKYTEKKGLYHITFEARGKRDNYSISIDVGISGYCWISIRPDNAELISYTGIVVMNENEEE